MKMRWFSLLTGLLLVAGSAEAWYGAPGVPGYGPYAYPQARGYSYQQAPRMRVRTGRDADGYLVRIQLQGLTPTEVNVNRSGRWLLVQTTSNQVDSEQAPGSYSYSQRFGSVSRRLSLPRNADLEAMIREDGENEILLRIPLLD